MAPLGDVVAHWVFQWSAMHRVRIRHPSHCVFIITLSKGSFDYEKIEFKIIREETVKFLSPIKQKFPLISLKSNIDEFLPDYLI
jgi:hypothetical protein